MPLFPVIHFSAILSFPSASKFVPVTSEKSQSSLGSELQSIESIASQGIIENIANFDSSSWLNAESDASSAKRLSNINKLKSLKCLLGSRSMESLTGHLSTVSAADEVISKHNLAASCDGRVGAREESDQDDDVVDWSQDPWGGFSDSMTSDGCEMGGGLAPAVNASCDIVFEPRGAARDGGGGSGTGGGRVRPPVSSRGGIALR